jgi:deazaflavin-dependent oxidoreductase (nitroreductase family)
MNLLFKAFVTAHTLLFRASGGKIAASMEGNELLLLTTKGSKTGKARTVPVMCFEDAGDAVVIASANGSPSHPAWFKNLERDPNVTVERTGKRFAARAEVASGERRARIWQNVVSKMPRFGGYQEKAQGREIPVVILKEVRAPN